MPFWLLLFMRQKTKQKHTKTQIRRNLDRGLQTRKEAGTQGEIHTHQVHIKTNKRLHTHTIDKDDDRNCWLQDQPGRRMWAEQEDTAVVTHAQDTEDYYGDQATANSPL